MTKLDLILDENRTKLLKAIDLLEFSYNKILKLDLDNFEKFSPDELEPIDSFVSRFCKSSELFLTKYLKSKIKSQDSGFEGTLRDGLNYLEKLSIIENANTWFEIRELRNVSVHDYSDNFVLKLRSIISFTPIVISLRNKV